MGVNADRQGDAMQKAVRRMPGGMCLAGGLFLMAGDRGIPVFLQNSGFTGALGQHRADQRRLAAAAGIYG